MGGGRAWREVLLRHLHAQCSVASATSRLNTAWKLLACRRISYARLGKCCNLQMQACECRGTVRLPSAPPPGSCPSVFVCSPWPLPVGSVVLPSIATAAHVAPGGQGACWARRADLLANGRRRGLCMNKSR